MGWGNPVVAGTVLQVAAIESPNFSIPGSAGWAIMQDGSAFFFQVTLRGDVILTGGGAVLVYNGAPALGTLAVSIAPSGGGTDPFGNVYGAGINVGTQTSSHIVLDLAGDLTVINSGQAIRLFLYNGDGSVRMYDPAGIAAGHLATVLSPIAGSDGAGNAYPRGLGSLSGSAGATVVDGGAVLVYTGAPALNDLFLALSGQASTDQYGNAYPQGLLMFNRTGGALAAPSTAIVLTAASGFVKYAAGGDGAIYDVGENVYFNPAAVNIPASGFTAVFTQAVGIGTYAFSGKMRLKQGAVGSIPGNIGFTGPASSFGTWDAHWQLQGATTTFESTPTLGFATQLNVLGVQTVAGDEVVAWFDGTVTFTAAGTFTIGCQADGTHPFTAQPGCKLRLRPVV